jgi:uncharacterized phage protein gp47/JayE
VTDFPSHRELFRIARDEVLTNTHRVSRAVIEREGTDVNCMTAAGVAIGDEVMGQVAQVEAGLYLGTAKGTALDRRVWDVYQTRRQPATPALVYAKFATTAPAAVGFAILASTQLGTSDGKQFATKVAANFPAGSSGPIYVLSESSKAGLSQAVLAGTLTSITGTITGSPADLVVTNDTASSGQGDEELDDDFLARARKYWTTAARGTLGAIERGALDTAGCRRASAFEIVDPDGTPARLAEVVVADQFTDQLVDWSGGIPAGYAVQSAALAGAVRANLWDFRAAGIQVMVTTAVVVLQPVALALRYQAGADTTVASAAAQAAIVATVNNLSPGESLDPAVLITALRRVPGLVVLGDEVRTPNGIVIPGTSEVLRTTMALVTVGA